ncbi:copper chaperone for superoxide dismutase [Sarcophilus harrisii]|uniref:Copper chaperone for superoxide dismutase n=3 Tax=Sarcophilus harrisii TaxID=9305 RepID=A0A7N4Q0Y4_SARHA
MPSGNSESGRKSCWYTFCISGSAVLSIGGCLRVLCSIAAAAARSPKTRPGSLRAAKCGSRPPKQPAPRSSRRPEAAGAPAVLLVPLGARTRRYGDDTGKGRGRTLSSRPWPMAARGREDGPEGAEPMSPRGKSVRYGPLWRSKGAEPVGPQPMGGLEGSLPLGGSEWLGPRERGQRSRGSAPSGRLLDFWRLWESCAGPGRWKMASVAAAAAPARAGDSKTACTLEFAVQMSCQSCVDRVRASLRGVAGIQGMEVQLENQSVLVTTTLPSQEVQDLLESTGCQAVLKGMGSHMHQNLGAAVAMIGRPGAVQGVVRFLQVSPKCCLIEGTIDGLEPGPHGLHVHQYGDLTENCASCGDHFNPDGMPHGGPQDAQRHRGDLGNVYAESDGRATFRLEDEQLQVWDIIGRSLVIDAGEDDLGRGGHPLSKITGNSGERLACGIIARSAGLFQNPKQICSCDGLTLWDERGRPIAGEGRKKPPQTPAHL